MDKCIFCNLCRDMTYVTPSDFLFLNMFFSCKIIIFIHMILVRTSPISYFGQFHDSLHPTFGTTGSTQMFMCIGHMFLG